MIERDPATGKIIGKRFALEELEAVMLGDNSTGFCRACGAEQDGCEPDARRYRCESCGLYHVYGGRRNRDERVGAMNTPPPFVTSPRPTLAIHPDLIHEYDARGWLGQLKKNGTSNLVFVSQGDLIFKTRRGTLHKRWTPTELSSHIFKTLPRGNFIFHAELLHSRTANVKDTNFIFDIYVAFSQRLDSLTFNERQEVLFKLFKPYVRDVAIDHFVLNEHT